jgi:succinyl-diaminopimelate desuccinylase
MCARPAVSPGSGGEGELDKALYIEAFLRENGFGGIERYDAPHAEAKGGVRPNLIATLPGKSDEGRLWVISHIDVVPPGEAGYWAHSPWDLQVTGDVLVGRGVEDNQQAVCSSIIAALAFLRAGIKPDRTVKLLFAADEENGSAYGIGHLVKNHGELFRADDAALIPDSGNSEGSEIEVAEKNLLWLKASISGRQAHGSRPDLGVNAHLAQAELALALHDGRGARFDAKDALCDPPFSTFEPTKIEANVPNVNTIPGSAVFYMDCRALPRYPLRELLAEAENIAREVAAKRGVTISFEAEQSQESPPSSTDSAFYKRLAAAITTTLGVKPRPIGIGGGTVAAYLRRLGLECAVWSKLDENAHKANESARISNILDEARVMVEMFGG